MRDKIYKTQAIVLRRYDFGEAGKQLVIYTPTLGKLSVLARGVKRTTSRMAGHLEPLSLSTVVAARGRNLDTITQADTVESFFRLRSEPEKLFHGFAVAELLDKLTPEQEEHRAVWDLFVSTLRGIEKDPDPWAPASYFNVRLLVLAGYAPELQVCVNCGEALDPRQVYYSPRLGGTLCPACRTADVGALAVSANAIKVLRLASGPDYGAYRAVKIGPALRGEIDALLRENVRRLLDVEMNSARLFKTLEQPAIARAPGDDG